MSVLVHAGVAPTVFTHRGDFSAFTCNTILPTDLPLVTFFKLPAFHKLFGTPWIIGGQLAYEFSECSALYAEINYRQASHRNFFAPNVCIPLDVVNISLLINNKFKAIDAYVGARLYSPIWCDQVALFVGGKFGIVHHKSVHFNYSIIPTPGPEELGLISTESTPLFLSHTAPAGGASIGLDWRFDCKWSVILMAEVVATCAPRSNTIIPVGTSSTFLPTILPNNLYIGSLGTELFFPITLGLQYHF